MKIPFKQRIIFFLLTVSAILSADLIITVINKKIMTYQGRLGIHIMTLLGMSVVLVIFFLLVSNINRIADTTVRMVVKIGKKYLGRSIGLYLSLIGIFTLLYSGYYWAWFGRNFFGEIMTFCKGIANQIFG